MTQPTDGDRQLTAQLCRHGSHSHLCICFDHFHDIVATYREKCMGEIVAAFEPVAHWYTLDGEGQEPSLSEKMALCIADLQEDRAECLRLRARVAELEAQLEEANFDMRQHADDVIDGLVGATDDATD